MTAPKQPLVWDGTTATGDGGVRYGITWDRQRMTWLLWRTVGTDDGQAALARGCVGQCPLLRARRERPRRCAAEQADDRAPPHSMTSSARTRNVSGIANPSVLAVLRFTTS